MGNPRCAVAGCGLASMHDVAIERGNVGVCSTHYGSLEREAWAYDAVRGELILGAELAAQGLLVVDQLATRPNYYAPERGPFTTLAVAGRVLGSGEPRGVEIILSDEVVRQLAKLVWMYERVK